MPLLTNIEQRALARGKEIGSKESYHKSICALLKFRFGSLPESLIQNLKQIEDISLPGLTQLRYA